MPEIYCTKCGLRGNSKCPHCRSVFEDYYRGDDDMLRYSIQYLEQFLVAKKYRDDQPIGEDGEQRYVVGVWTYAANSNDALLECVKHLYIAMNGLNQAALNIVACMHDWQLMPGQKSSIDCGHEGKKDAVVPPNPFDTIDKTE